MSEKRKAALAASGLLLTAVAGCAGVAQQEAVWPAPYGGAEARVWSRGGPDDARAAVAEIERKLLAASAALEPDGDGPLASVNARAAEEWVRVEDVDVWTCLTLAFDYAADGGGAYDPTLGPIAGLHAARAAGLPPSDTEVAATLDRVGFARVTLEKEARAIRFGRAGMRLELGPVARGCAVDVAARTFARPGIVAGRVSAGPVTLVWGVPPGGVEPWVAVADPRDPSRRLVELQLVDRAVAAVGHRAAPGPDGAWSGEGLVIDPATGRPAATDLEAAVALGDGAADAAAMAASLFVAGSLRGPAFLARTGRAEAVLWVRASDGSMRVLASASLRGRLRPDEGVAWLLPPQTISPLPRSP